MPAWFVPDPARDVARMGARAEQLERTVRHGKAAGNMRDLADADLWKVQDGEVPTYDAASGRWVPGTGGSLPTIVTRVSTSGAAGDAPNGLFKVITPVVQTNVGGFWTLSGTTISPAANCIALVAAAIGYDSDPAGVRWAQVRVNGTNAAARYMDAIDDPGTDTIVELVAALVLSAGDDVDFRAFQNSGVDPLSLRDELIALTVLSRT